MKILHKPQLLHPLIAFLVFLMLAFTFSCSYYKAVDHSPAQFASSLNPAKSNESKVYYLHGHNQIVQIEDIQLQGKTMSARIVPDSLYRQPANPGYKYLASKKVKTDNKGMFNEVHLYLNPSQSFNLSDSIQLNTSEIASIETIQHDGGKEVMAAALSAALVVLLGAAIAGATKEPEPEPQYTGSCPYAYAFNGQEYSFEGELYTGAIFQNLERHDYLYLPSIRALKEQYAVRLKNKLNETEYTNLTELIVVNHPKGANVLLDENGKAFTVSQPVFPQQAISSSGKNQLPYITEKDRYYYSFDDIQNKEQELILSFSKPANNQAGKLLLSTKNTTWGDQVIQAFMSKMGHSYTTWQSQEEKREREDRILDFLKWEFPISVSIKNRNDWQLAGNIFPVGPLGERDIVLPLNLANHSGDIIEIKLSSGFQFWDINQVSLDFSENQKLHIQKLLPIGIKHTDEKALQALLYDDEKYQKMEYGDFVDLYFHLPDVPPNMEQSVFLHAKGYYEYIINSSTEPDLVTLKKFEEPGYFSDFSKSLYKKQLKELEALYSKQ